MAGSGRSLPVPSIQILLASYLVLIAFMLGLGWPWPQDPDVWWHLKTGEWMVQKDRIMRTDPFGLSTQGMPVILPSWLAEILFYRLNRADPYLSLRILQALVVAVTTAILLTHAWLASRSFRLALLLAFLFLVPVMPWVARPQIFSFMFVALTMLILWWGENKDIRALWVLPPLLLLWANVHAYFIVGLGFVYLFLGLPWLRWLFRKPAALQPPLLTLWILGLAALAPLANPYGFRLYEEILFMAAHASGSWAAEWILELQSPNFQDWPMKVFYCWVAAALLALLLSARRPSGLVIFLFLGLLFQSLQHRRDVAYFVIVFLPIIAEHMAQFPWPTLRRALKIGTAGRALQEFGSGRAVLHWLLLAGAFAGLAFAPHRLASALPAPETVPDFYGASRYLLKEKPPAPIYNSLGKGGFLIYALWPNYRVFIDGRTGLYSDRDWQEHNDVRHGRPGWQDKLLAGGICTVVWESKEPLVSLLQLKPDWARVYQDEHAVIFVRKQCQSPHLSASPGYLTAAVRPLQ